MDCSKFCIKNRKKQLKIKNAIKKRKKQTKRNIFKKSNKNLILNKDRNKLCKIVRETNDNIGNYNFDLNKNLDFDYDYEHIENFN